MLCDFRIEDWLVQPLLSQLEGPAGVERVEPRSIQVLAFLAERAGEVVSREDLLAAVWGETFVAEEVLTHAIWDLRRALGDDSRKPRFIQTVSRRGYRLTSAVSWLEPALRAPTPGKPSRLDERTPYPGLAPYTEAEAALFFGREAEVDAVWARLRRRELLAIISPSGAGKTSFLRAGLLPALPGGWRAVLCQPAGAPWRSLAQALVPELAGDHESLRQLLRFEEPEAALPVLAAWRRRHAHVLLVVDQFEELFTQNGRDVQARFAELLGRAAGEAGVHVLLALRDDFLFSCHAHPALAPIFAELTPLGPPAGAGLRRALVEPAQACGYRFEDAALVEEMLADVAQERGALPLLAFAASRLWEDRDREAGLLTWRAYRQIGGVAGALARHAEATLAGIGEPRQPLVREIFRNLITVQGTRAAMDVEELLSIFAGREEARPVLTALLDARLLTSFEVPGSGESPGGRWVEIIHESLLSAWPRLVRWRTQDADGAQLRDQLRQAARLWESRGRPADLLWTGASFLELQVWRQRYPAALTATEEAFVRATTEQAGRRRRRRRLTVAAAFAILLAVLLAVGLLWWKAAREARRAEASKLVALARLELDRNPSAAVAYGLASLELTDSLEARRLALEALWQGPTAFVARRDAFNWSLDFSPDGRWLAVGGDDGNLAVWSQDGSAPRVFSQQSKHLDWVRFGAGSDTVVAYSPPDQTLRVWSTADGKPLRARRLTKPLLFSSAADRRRVFALRREGSRAALESWPFDGGQPSLLGRVEWKDAAELDPGGNWLAFAEDRELRLLPISGPGTAPATLVGRHESPISRILFAPGRLASLDTSGELRLWPLPAGSAIAGSRQIQEPPPLRLLRGLGRVRTLQFDAEASRLATADYDQALSLWDLGGPPEAEPTVLRQGEDVLSVVDVAFHPAGRWLAAAYIHGIALWPLSRPYPRILRAPGTKLMALAFAPDGSSIVSASQSGDIRLWPLTGSGAASGRVLFAADEDRPRSLSADPAGRYVAAGFNSGKVRLLPLGPGPSRVLDGFRGWVWPVAVGPGGRLVAAGGSSPWETVIRVWDLETGEVRILDAGDGKKLFALQFLPDGRLASAGEGGLRLWRLDGSSRVLRKGFVWSIATSRDGRHLLSAGGELNVRGEAVLFDLVSGGSRPLPSHGSLVGPVALDPGGTMAITAGFDGVVRVGPVTGEAPHLLLGHRGTLWAVAVHPDGRWIATAGEDRTIRLWPMPQGRPFHTLPYEEFLARLRALTNYRVVPDGRDPTGYRLDIAPFPGWATVPVW